MTFRKLLNRITKSVAYTGYVLSVLFLVLSVVLSLGIKPVLADEGNVAEPETPASEPASSEADSSDSEPAAPAPDGDDGATTDDEISRDSGTPEDDNSPEVEEPDAPVEEGGIEELPAEEQPVAPEEEGSADEEIPVDESVVPVEEEMPETLGDNDESSEPSDENDGASGETEIVEEPAAEIVELLSEEGKQLINEEGETISLASEEAQDILAGSDPFYWDVSQSKWIGYTTDGTGCPANVECHASATPFQAAVDNAPAGAMIYVAQGEYHETVTINNANQSFTAFSLIEALLDGSIGSYTSGYASVDKFILNALFGTTNGVYGKEIVVNNSGRLDDGLSLVEKDGHVTANVKLISSGDYYIIQDANDASISFEWECGEPDMLIYPGSGNIYQMIFKAPLDADIVNYYTTTSPDERGFGMSATDRLNDLLIAANVSTRDNWSSNDEKLIFWYLLGNRTYDGKDIWTQLMNNSQRLKTISILNGSNDAITQNRGIWFLWPTLQNGQSVSPFNRQLTFINYSNRVIRGCTDEGSDNYNPNATVDDGSCITIQYGCTDPSAINFNASANVDDGSCVPVITGCTDPTSINYNPSANTDDGSCVPVITGCTDPTAINYNSSANTDDGSCVPVITGCTDETALNYNPEANTDDGSCVPVITGCTDETALNYNSEANTDDGSCVPVITGCTDETALNYNPEANTDDGSCSYITGDDDDTDDDDIDDDDMDDDDSGDDDDVTGDDDDVTGDDDDTPVVEREMDDDDFAGGGLLPQFANEVVPTLAAPGDPSAVASEMMLPVTGIDLSKGAANPALFFNLSLVSLGIGMIAHTVTKKQRDE
jgi:hypothetical protein